MSHFPNETPHVIANRIAAKDSDDKGACYIERPDLARVIVTVRSPGEKNESKVTMPLKIWRELIAHTVR